MENIKNSILETVGSTPLVRINSLNTGMAEVLVKVESRNPGGSVKDRVGIAMVEDAEVRGLIKPGFIADLVIFDENTLDSPADFGNCAAAPQGIKRIISAGETAWDEREPDRIQRLGKFIAVD